MNGEAEDAELWRQRGRVGEALITGEHAGTELLRERDVERVRCGQVVAVAPGSGDERGHGSIV